MKFTRLPEQFYHRSTLEVARDMLGKLLVFDDAEGRKIARVVETEAYDGPEDAASHASKKRTARNAVMFGPPGHVYVYLIYGMYHCLNFVTGPRDYPAAVLVRGVEPLAGISSACNGPGRLCRAMGISLENNTVSALDGPLYLADDDIGPVEFESTPRIGVDYAGAWAAKPYRFFVRGNPHVSKMRPKKRA